MTLIKNIFPQVKIFQNRILEFTKLELDTLFELLLLNLVSYPAFWGLCFNISWLLAFFHITNIF